MDSIADSTTPNFNPRPREGGDAAAALEIEKNRFYFNPRPREGGDFGKKSVGISAGGISIHAPARGATLADALNWAGVSISIHAPARGATAAARRSTDGRIISIHAPARGAT